MSQDWVSQRERSNVLTIRVLVFLGGLFGRRIARAILHPICVYFLLSSPTARAASRAYLARALRRPARLKDVYRHFYTFATVALDRFYFLTGRFEKFDVRIEGEALLRTALEAGGGCFLIGAHLGSFEALRTLGRGRHVPVKLVMYEDNARKIIAVAKALDPELASSVIALGRFDSMLRVAESLDRGEWLGVLGDRALDDSGCIGVPFFGAPAPFPTAPLRMAAMLKRPVILMVALFRGGNRYDLHFEPLLTMDDLARRDRADALPGWVAHYAARLEHYAREAPYNWFNFFDFWDERKNAR